MLDKLRDYLPETRRADVIVAALDYRKAHQRWPRRRNALYSDALHWLKIGGALSDPLRVLTTDKLLAKLYIDAMAGAGLAVPTLQVLESREEVERCEFPRDCVIKPTHLCGRIQIRRDGAAVDRKKVASWLDMNYYHVTRERNYRELRPRVIVEPFALGQAPARDWNFFVVRGQVRMIVVDHGEVVDGKPRRARYTGDWVPIPIGALGQAPATPQPPPANLRELIEISCTLGSHFSFLRVDLYTDGSRIQVGELTHCAGAAMNVYENDEAESELTRVLFGAPRIDATEIERRA